MKIANIVSLIGMVLISACGGTAFKGTGDIPAIYAEEDVIVRGRAEVTVTGSSENQPHKDLGGQAATGSTTVTYTNAAAVNFTINVAALVAGAFTGNTLSLGHVDLSTLSDNNLKICNPGGNTKCTQAIIRTYSTGTVQGFVNTVDSYGLPLFAGTLAPTTAIGLNTTGAVQLQTYIIPITDHKVTIADFTTTAYNVTSDFSNAGAGNYSVTLVLEYVLAP